MSERKRGNRTEGLQVALRNYRSRDRYGSHSIGQSRHTPEPIVQGTIIKVDPKRRAKFRQVSDTHKRILDRALELSIEGKAAAEIMNDLGLPSHSILPDTQE